MEVWTLISSPVFYYQACDTEHNEKDRVHLIEASNSVDFVDSRKRFLIIILLIVTNIR